MRIRELLPAILFLAALPAEGATTYYCTAACGANDENAFNTAMAALLNSGPVNFSGETPGTVVSDVGPTQVDFAGFNGITPATLNVSGTQLQQSVGGTSTTVQLQFGPGTLAIGLHLTQSTGTARPWCFETAGSCQSGAFILVNGTTTFVGVISDVPLLNHQLRQQSGTNLLFINDFTVAETPEGSTFLLVGLGLISFVILKRKLKASPPASEPSPQY